MRCSKKGATDINKRQFSGKLSSTLIHASVIIILLVILLVLPQFMKGVYYLHIFILTFIYLIVTSSLRLIAISGQISVGHAAFMGIGAYCSAVLAKELGWTPWVTMPIGGLAAMAIAALVGFPFVRIRTIYFSMVSLFFGIWTLSLFSVLDEWTGPQSAGLMGIPPLFSPPGYKLPYYYFFLGLAALCLFIIHRIEFSRIGVTWKAIAQSFLVASSVGINESRQRILCLAVGSFFAGLAGAGYAHYAVILTHSSFDVAASLNLLVYTVIGGIGGFVGPIIGAVFLIAIPEFLRGLKEFVPYVSAVILLVVVFAFPNGLVDIPKLVRSLFEKLRK